MKRVILIPIETACRELYSKIFLAYKFASKGCEVFLGDKQNIQAIADYVDGSVFFDKGYHKDKSDHLYELLNQRNIKIVSLDEENAVDSSNFQQLDLRFPDHILNRFDLVFLWGKKQKQHLSKNRKNFESEKFVVSGHPRFELLTRSYQQLYAGHTNAIKEKYGEFILINTNFGLGNNIKGDAHVLKNYVTRFPQVKELMDYQKKQAYNFVDLCRILSDELNLRIILRPHPEESHEFYISKLEPLKNVTVSGDHSVIPWIAACKHLIHHDCTTSLESAMLGKNSVAYTKDLNTELTTDIPLRISYQYDQASKVIEHIKGKNRAKLNNKILQDYFNFPDINTTEIVRQTINLTKPIEINASFFLFKLKTSIKDIFRDFGFLRNDELYQKKIDGLDLKSVSSVLNDFNALLNEEVSVNKISKRLFKIF